LQVDVELRLKDPDSDGAKADAATDIRQEVIGVIEVEDKAFALEIRPQAAPITGQGRLAGFGRLVRSLCLRPSRRPKIIGRAVHEKRGKGKRPPPMTPADHAHNPPPEQ
jgi:hypothetical protein